MSSPRLPLSARPSFLPDEISRREFATVFRGYDASEVRTFLNQLSEQAAEASDRLAEVSRSLAETEERVRNPELDEEMATKLLGDQTAQILRSAREAANETRSKAEAEVSRSLREAHEVTTKMREEAETILAERTEEAERMAAETRAKVANEATTTLQEAEEEAQRIRDEVARLGADMRAEASAEVAELRSETHASLAELRKTTDEEIATELESARRQGRDLVETARAEAHGLVERTQEQQVEMVEGLVRKRKIALAQVEELRAGRQRLLKAYKMVRGTLDEVTAELERVEEEARQAAELAGVRSAQSTDLPQEELDTVVQLEQYNLDDDVPATVIDLIEGRETTVPGAGRQPYNSDDDLDDFDTDTIIDLDGGSRQPTLDDEDFDSFSFGADLAGGSGDGGSVTTMAGQMTDQQTEQQPPDLTVVSDDDAVQDEQGDETAEDIRATSTSLIFADSRNAFNGEEMDQSVLQRREAVVNKARGQAVRRVKRALQDEQDALVASLRHGEAKSVQALLGSVDDQASAYNRAVVRLLREVVRDGAAAVADNHDVDRNVIDQAGNAAARGLATELVQDLRTQLQPVLEEMLNAGELPAQATVSNLVAAPYRVMKSEYLDQLLDERIGGAFDQGFSFARPNE